MSLSVVMANYNHAAWLPRSLTALLAQNPGPDELIIVDDGSTDDSVAIIESFKARHPSIRLIRHDSNRGVAAAVQTGLAVASGEFLIGAAADDLVLPGLFARGTAALRAYPEAALFCAEAVLVDCDDNILGFRPIVLPRFSSGFISATQARHAIRRSDNWFLGTGVIYRRRCLADVGYFDACLGSLTDSMTNRLLAVHHGFFFEAQVLSAWRIYPESFSGRSGLSRTESARMIEAGKRWIETRFPDDMRRAYPRVFERRLRFNLARQRLVWAEGKIDSDSIGAVMQWGAFDRSVLRALAALPFMPSKLVLVWLGLRAHPFALWPLLRSFLRNLVLGRSRRHALRRLLAGRGR